MHLPLSLLLLITPFLSPSSATTAQKQPKPLTGRFLHLTDIHPDSFYSYNSSVSAACHWDKINPKRSDRAGWWGTGSSDCDTPSTLLTSLFSFLEPLKGEIDFVVWTGDNARHDIDSKVPRSLPEIMRLNKELAVRVRETLGKSVPIVASVGNNDVFPHNIMWPGPSSITSELLETWKHFIPESNKHTFARGGYYSVEAIPETLLLVSLNTLYFYENNKIVDGCPDDTEDMSIYSTTDPGTEHLQWLEQQLLLARSAGMQVWLTGHVPPTQAGWYPQCFDKYTELTLRFHDTIVGQLFGHMNVDHFNLLSTTTPSEISTKVATSNIISNLYQSFSSLPPKPKPKDYSIVHISPSVIPTYWPSVRIWNYNTSVESRWKQGDEEVPLLMKELKRSGKVKRWFKQQIKLLGGERIGLINGDEEDEDDDPSMWEEDEEPSKPLEQDDNNLTKKKKKKKKHPKLPKLPRYYSRLSPSNQNRFLTPLGYTQFHLNMDLANSHSGYGPGLAGERLFLERGEEGERPLPNWGIEYITTTPSKWVSSMLKGSEGGGAVPKAMLMERTLNKLLKDEDEVGIISWLERNGRNPYGMKDGTVKEWLKVAKKLVRDGDEGKKWKKFLTRMFVGCGVKE